MPNPDPTSSVEMASSNYELEATNYKKGKAAPLPARFQHEAAANQSSEDAEMILKCNTAYIITKEELPSTKSKIILMKKNRLNRNPAYSNDTDCAHFIGVIANTLFKSQIQCIFRS